MSDTHKKLQYGNKYNHWKFWDLVRELHYFSFSHPNPNHNPTYLPKHEVLSPNNQFYQHIWYVEYYSVHALHGVKSEISLDTGVGMLGWRKWNKRVIILCGHNQQSLLHPF